LSRKGRLAELLAESSTRVDAANVRADVAAAENAILALNAAGWHQIAAAANAITLTEAAPDRAAASPAPSFGRGP
jgi:hypothetical protein